MKSLVTVAVASYNNALYIERCVESILNQTYQYLDILIVDDGSEDDSLSRLDKFTKDIRLRVISQKNGGLSSVRQRCINEAKGEYICFIDADDYLFDNYVSSLLNKIQSENSDICICSTKVVNEDGSINFRDTQAFNVNDIEQLKLSVGLLATKHSYISGLLSLSDSWNKMYSISFLRNTGVKFQLPKGYNGTDLVFNHKVALYEPKYSFTPYAGYCHVLYKKSAVRRKKKELQSGFQFIIKDIIEESKIAGNFAAIKGKIINLYYYLLRYALQDRNDETLGYYCKIKEVFISRQLHFSFVSEDYFLKHGFKDVETNSLRIFYLLLRFAPVLLPLYFSFRKKYI